MPNNYVLCLKHGTKYGAEYVNTLYNMVKRHTTIPVTVVCYTEDPRGIIPEVEIRPIPLHSDIKGWWYKPMFFNPAQTMSFDGPQLYMDLDIIIFKNIDNLFSYKPGEFCVIRDFNRAIQSNWDRMNSSIFRLHPGQHPHVYENFMTDPSYHAKRYHGDQDWLYANVKSQFEFWPDEWIQSYKWEMRGRPEMSRATGKRNFVEKGNPTILPETSIAVFHGDPNPKDCIDDWCTLNWR